MGTTTDEPMPISPMSYFNHYLNLDIIAEIVGKLYADLPPSLSYHSVHHTLQVIHYAILFAVQAGHRPVILEKLAIMAAFHDAGDLVRRHKNEGLGAVMAGEAMKRTGRYEEGYILSVQEGIEDTEIRSIDGKYIQVARSEHAKFLLDADLFSFGHRDFLVYTNLLAMERGIPLTERKQFYKETLEMMEYHRWHTREAHALLDVQKRVNMMDLHHLTNSR